MDLKIQKIVVSNYRTNCYLVTSEKDLALIDPGGEPEKIEEALGNFKGYNFRYLFLTHAHHDHFGAANSVALDHDFQIVVGKKEAKYFEEVKWQEEFDNIKIPKIKADITVAEGQRLAFGNTEIKVLETPGHSVGDLSFLIEENIFTGDALFYHTVGRTDFPGGDALKLAGSLKKILQLDPGTTVWPGHGWKTTIDEEKRYLKKHGKELGFEL